MRFIRTHYAPRLGNFIKKPMTRKFFTPLKDHGFIVALFCWLFSWIRCILPYYRWFKLAEKIEKECVYDRAKKKPKPVWQDMYVLIIVVLTILILICNWLHWIILITCVWILLDIFVYHANVLWLDDIRPKRDYDIRVWSHRRIVFVALINFAETIAIFSILYRIWAGIPATILHSLLCSFRSATTLDFPEAFLNSASNVHWAHTIWGAQILCSLFFIVIVIATLAAIGYKRDEIANSEKDHRNDL